MQEILDNAAFSGLSGVMSAYDTSSHNTFIATQQTVEQMRRLVYGAMQYPNVQEFARKIWGKGIGRVTQNGESELVQALWDAVRQTVRFREDERLVEQGIDGRELLISPEVLLQMPQPMGDCDDFSMLVASVLKLWQYEPRFITAAANVDYPNVYSHVWVRVQMRTTGEWIDIDASHGPYLGWNVLDAPVFASVELPMLTEWVV
jgi:transglutaminase-like putative cysteine protease